MRLVIIYVFFAITKATIHSSSVKAIVDSRKKRRAQKRSFFPAI